MSNVNIRRAVENIRTGTTVYTPLVEMIVNAIQAIEVKGNAVGEVVVTIERSAQHELDGKTPAVTGFSVKDNGIGFTDENRDSFDTLYSDYKIDQGGKGFGRFTCLKYFEDLKVESVYRDGSSCNKRTFKMGKGNDIIVSEKIVSINTDDTYSLVSLVGVKSGKFLDKKLRTIAKVLVERLLPYFIDVDFLCPKISLREKAGDEEIVLNNFVDNQLSGSIVEIPLPEPPFAIPSPSGERRFSLRIFKFYAPGNQRSKVSLVAHRREVTDTAIHNSIPEFYDEFFDEAKGGADGAGKNYIVKGYVVGDYLDEHVSLERGGFDFQKESDLVYGISQADIESCAAEKIREALGDEITRRQEKKRERVNQYVDENAPWHKEIVRNIDLSTMPTNASSQDIEMTLQKEKFIQETQLTQKVKKLVKDGTLDELKENVNELVNQISETSKNDLTHYIALRRQVLELFQKNLELDPDGKYSSEGTVHDIIFPRKKDSDSIKFEEHNLWIVDERLTFTNYVSSDQPLNGVNSDRPDLMAYDRRVVFRGDNEASNPVTIFEFKKPQRDDFVNPSSDEDPVQQIVRYVNQIREGKYKTPQGRKMLVSDNTPFYGYVVCDITAKVERWLEFEKDYKEMPDKLGWYRWHDNINLYMEVISWDKILKDAEMRNRIFFHKLGIA